MIETTETLADVVRKIDDIVIRYEQQNRVGYAGDLDWRVDQMIRHYQNIATNQLAGVKATRDDMLVWLRALAMVAEMAGNAGTHAEKNARLRGMVELIEAAIQKLREQEFNFQWSTWHMPDIFRSDYPVVQYIRRIHELEAQLREQATANPNYAPTPDSSF